MSQLHENWIRQRAHMIWEREGRPDGRHDEHWRRAIEEVDSTGEGQPKGAGREAASTASEASAVAKPVKARRSSSRQSTGSTPKVVAKARAAVKR